MIGFARECFLALGDGGAQFLEALGAVGPLPFDVLEAQPFLGDSDFGLLQVASQPVTIPRAPVHALLQVADLVADLFELLLLDLGKTGPVILSRGTHRHDEEQQEQGRQAAHGRTV